MLNHTTGLFKYIPIAREHKPNIFEIDYEKFLKWGFNTILFDYDYTIAVWKDKKLNNETLELFEYLHILGFKVAIVTNSKIERTRHVEDLTKGKVKVFADMKKPSIKKLKEVLIKLNSDNEKTVIIGDLFLTDVVVGNRLGLYSILINPYIYEIDSNFKKLAAKLSEIIYSIFFFSIGWFFKLMDLAIPNEFKTDIFEIDYENLFRTKHSLIIFDFDNTLVPYRTKKLNEKVIDLIKNIKNIGFDILIATNGRNSRFNLIKEELNSLDINVQTLSLKPTNFKIMKHVKKLNHQPRDCVLIGDQLFTDVIAGNVSGFYTIKVEPLSKNEKAITKFNRKLEKISLKIMRKKPEILKGENKNEM